MITDHLPNGLKMLIFSELINIFFFNSFSSFQDAEDFFIILEPLLGGDMR